MEPKEENEAQDFVPYDEETRRKLAEKIKQDLKDDTARKIIDEAFPDAGPKRGTEGPTGDPGPLDAGVWESLFPPDSGNPAKEGVGPEKPVEKPEEKRAEMPKEKPAEKPKQEPAKAPPESAGKKDIIRDTFKKAVQIFKIAWKKPNIRLAIYFCAAIAIGLVIGWLLSPAPMPIIE